MLLEYFRLHFSQGVILFTAYSFLGWVIEVIYRSFSAKKFINAGFLAGPFTPIYGFGAAVLVSISLYAAFLPLPLAVFLFAASTVILELIVGIGIEKIFGFRLWDYSKNRFNFRGIICPSFAFLWTILALVFIYLIHPFFYSIVETIPDGNVSVWSFILIGYFALDSAASIITLTGIKKNLPKLIHHYTEIPSLELQKILGRLERFAAAFPDLNSHIEKMMTTDMKDKINALLSSLKSRFAGTGTEANEDAEFSLIAGEITSNAEYQRLKTFMHHRESIYDHIMQVAYLSFKISKQLKLDYRSATRGALLHDFFCYDWRNHDLPDLDRKKFHGLHHPRIALMNAEKYFPLNDTERDIIVKHMWPLTISPPRHIESFIVTFADKYVASKEYSVRFSAFVKDRTARIMKKGTELGRKIRERR
jgi:uncharacterized membrane protein/HD superfamily phosphodiesterase